MNSRPTIIAIDGYEANVANKVGIGRYAYEMLTHIYLARTTQKFCIYLPDVPRADMPKETEWWRYRVVGPKKLWTFIGLPLAIFFDSPRADVIFSPTHYIPRWISVPKVMSIMDCSYLHFPELFRPKDLHQLTRGTAYGASHAARILTISQFSKNAIIQAYKKRETDVVVTYPGLMDIGEKTSLTSFMELEQQYRLSKHYILSVGTIQPRKNYIRLIAAFAQFLEQNKQKFGKIDLVIVGKKGWLYEEILAAPQKYGISDAVKFLDFVPDRDLPTLYKHALCFALPSLYEGFGLPVLEAMAQGTPVVVSSVSSLPEIAGEAGIYVNPEDTFDITKGLLAAVRQRNLIQGRQRIKKGLERVKQFTWEKAAAQTIEVLEQASKQT